MNKDPYRAAFNAPARPLLQRREYRLPMTSLGLLNVEALITVPLEKYARRSSNT